MYYFEKDYEPKTLKEYNLFIKRLSTEQQMLTMRLKEAKRARRFYTWTPVVIMISTWIIMLSQKGV